MRQIAASGTLWRRYVLGVLRERPRVAAARRKPPDVSRCPGLADAEGLAPQVSEFQNRVAGADTVGASIMPFCAPW